ncbi:MAG: cell division protein FtsZ, partial [bacterium]|nr:cell division protein FtsZ [bacterium]
LLDVSITGAKGVLFSIAGGEDLTMFEIQDAAKIITESIDPQAKVIFGTVRDDKLKKNEVKVTVIAAGFPDGVLPAAASIPGIITGTSKASPLDSQKEVPVVEEKRSRLFNSSPAPASVAVKDIKEKIEEKKGVKNDDDDDWDVVPAFLRRSKLK